MKNTQHIRFLLIAPVITLAVIWFHRYLPMLSLPLLSHDKVNPSLYADGQNGGGSSVEWLDESNFSWTCHLSDTAEFPYCGMSMAPVDNQGLDLSRYQSLKLKIDYEGPAEKIRIYLRNQNPTDTPDDPENEGKFISLQLNTAELDEAVTLLLSEFSVADWWVEQNNVPRSQARPAFDNITGIGIDFAHPYPFGKHSVSVRELEFSAELVSAENWYLGIISLWVSGLCVFAIWRWSLIYQHAQRNTRRVSELKEINRQLESAREEYKQLTKTDPLTGAFNRLGFTETVELMLGKRQVGDPLSLILFSIDQFKRAKDRFGLNETEMFLQKVAGLIQDVAGEKHVLCRWEGDEFILLCPDTLAASAYLLAENIRKKIRDAANAARYSRNITVSAGVTEILDEEGFASAFKKIDDALFKAKSIGGNCTIMG